MESYPAKFDNVIGVTSLDANGDSHLLIMVRVSTLPPRSGCVHSMGGRGISRIQWNIIRHAFIGGALAPKFLEIQIFPMSNWLICYTNIPMNPKNRVLMN